DSGPSPALLERWGRRRDPRVGAGPPRNGLELLLEMERRGLCHEGDFGHLRQLLRLVTRHDLLRCVTLKRPRPVSPERVTCIPAMGGTCPSPPRPRPEHWETGEGWGGPWRSLGVTLGAWGKPWRAGGDLTGRSSPVYTGPHWSVWVSLCPADIRLRVRAEYCEHERALRRGVASSRPRGPGRQLDVFGQASGVLKSRDLGSILCDIKFSELSYLEAFWGDYL
ncbi:DEDD protein, partial [Struthidea cinerea]|nr:DEDD protein [Struthidea cinerea]